MQQQNFTPLYPPLQVRAGVLVVDGFGIALRVLYGKLHVSDGLGRQRRSIVLDRAGSGLERLVLIGKTGSVTLEALAWLRAIGAALVQITISSSEVLKPLATFNTGRPYAQQIKPFNFILSCHVAPFGHPVGADPERFHLIAPYESDPRKWRRLRWIDQYTEQGYRISTSLASGTRTFARVKSYGDVLQEYEFHEEAKCADATGAPCREQSIGLLGRRHIRIEKLHFIGKESNKLEEVEEQSASDAADVYTEYPDPRRDEWTTEILPILRTIPLRELVERSGLSRRALQMIRAGRRPNPQNRAALLSVISRNYRT
jgi:hypothetical protein